MEQKNNSEGARLDVWPLVLTFCTVSILLIYFIYTEDFVFGSVLGNWVYRYYTRAISVSFILPVVLFALTALFLWEGIRLVKKAEKIALPFGLFLSFSIQLLFTRISLYRLSDLITSSAATSFYSVARLYSLWQLLSKYQTIVATFPLHARTNMPGKILFFNFLSLVTSDPQIMGYLIIFISSLGGLLLYGIVKHLFNDRIAGWYSFILYTLIPCKQDFIPILNTVSPVFILLSLYLLVRYLETKKKWLLFLLGISFYDLILFESSPLVTGLIFVAVLLYALGQKVIAPRDLVWIVAIPVISFAAVYAFFWAFFSFDLWTSFWYTLNDAASFDFHSKRPYLLWIRDDTKEFFYAVGLPVSFFFLYTIFSSLRHWKDLFKNILQWSIDNLYLVSLTLTFLIVLFLGINRGEITRLWIYLAVFFQVPSAVFLAREGKSKTLFFIVAATLILQTVITLEKVSFITA